MQKVRFIDSSKSQFYATTRERVEEYFRVNNLSKHANTSMVIKTIFYLSMCLGLYVGILSNQFSPGIMLIMCILLGMTAAFIGFNVCHDAIHGSYSANPMVNKGLSFIFNLLGANPYVWSIMHNIVHHTFTNIPGYDKDIDVAPGLIRLSPTDKLTKIQRYQHLYAFLLYGFASLSWVFRKDFVKFFEKFEGVPETKHPTIEYFNLFFYKGLYYFLTIVLPFILLDITIGQFLIGFLSLHIAKGVVLGLVFQLAHVVEGTSFPQVSEEGNIEESWAVHQMQTTANFARTNPIATFLCGGLNMQIEHHLFPKICHIHYPAISEIVKKTAEEQGVPYIESPTFWQALISHYKMLKYFGSTESVSSEARLAA